MSRIRCLALGWMIAFGALAVTVPALRAGGVAPGADETRLTAAAMRAIDGKIEVHVWLETPDGAGRTVRQSLSARDPITWAIERGEGRLYEDPGTARILFEPLGEETLVVRPRMGRLVGDPVTIGISPDSSPHPGFRAIGKPSPLSVSGGGACGHRMGPRMFDEPVDVRSVVSSTVIPVSQTEAVVRYAHGDYYSYHPNVGPMRIYYNPNETSEVRLKSLSPTGEPFFPAVAEGDLYFIIETLDNGWKIANWEPMTIHATVLKWPPFETPIVNDKGVTFYSVDQPEVEVHRIAYQELYLYRTSEIQVETLAFGIEDGVLRARFSLQNQTRTPGDIRWFVVGDVQEPVTETRGLVRLEANGKAEVAYEAKVTPSALSQFITLGAVSQSGPRLLGHKTVTFDIPAAGGGQKVALIDQSVSKLSRSQEVLAAVDQPATR